MNIFIILCIAFMAATGNVQASTINLKDGRTVTGDIIQQDNNKVIIKEGDSTLTYYKDEITAIDGEQLTGGDKDTEKEKLIQQLLAVYPTSKVISDFVGLRYSPKEQKAVLSVLNDDQNIQAITQLRINGWRLYYSVPDLELAIKISSSKDYMNAFNRYFFYIYPQIFATLRKELKETKIQEK